MKPSGEVRRELDMLRLDAKDLAADARQLAREYEEAYDAGLQSLRSGSGAASGSTRPKGSVSDPTGASATSFEYRRIKGAASHAGRKVEKARSKLGAARREIADALNALHDAWLDTDPDLRDERREKRAAVRELAENA